MCYHSKRFPLRHAHWPPPLCWGQTVRQTASASSRGSVTFSYLPTAAARHAASAVSAPTSDKQDTFSINVDDGHGGVTAVPVTVTISPQNTPRRSPTTRLLCWGSRPTPRPQSDADGDFLTCTITTSPAKGNVLINVLINLNLGLVGTIVYTANNLVIPAYPTALW